ncbi:MAG: HK97 gp10 family phage protein [Ruminococcus flavefaciens]|nr:HK97 gp10 family phage protein [Ruminococcus flavefaciens]
MSSRITISDLASAVNEAMSEYRDLTEETLKSAVTEVAKETKDIAKSGSPSLSGKYRKGWATKKTVDSSGQISITVYNQARPGLTHLLEKGHAKRGGGRVSGTPHIAPAEDYAVTELEARIRRELS